MAHSIEIWRESLGLAEPFPPRAERAAEAELPGPEEGCEAVIELCRQYPFLSRILAEYLAR